MKQRKTPTAKSAKPIQGWQIEGREWWLWSLAVVVTVVLTFGIVSLTFFQLHPPTEGSYWLQLKEWVRGLACVVLLFDIYTLYQHMQLQRIRRRLAERDQLFQLITENAADMIAVVDGAGQRIYNSPAYEHVLGYSSEELRTTSSIDQVHPDDRARVLEAAHKARSTGQGQRLEYRIRHKDGTWRILESTASAVRDPKGKTEKLVIVNRDISERKRAEEMLAHNAFHDGLTNLPNRALFLDRLQRAFALSKRHADYVFAVLFVDIDEFKVFNDSLGHTVGDEVLIQIGQRLTASLREVDTISRPHLTESAKDDTLARRWRRRIHRAARRYPQPKRCHTGGGAPAKQTVCAVRGPRIRNCDHCECWHRFKLRRLRSCRRPASGCQHRHVPGQTHRQSSVRGL